MYGSVRRIRLSDPRISSLQDSSNRSVQCQFFPDLRSTFLRQTMQFSKSGQTTFFHGRGFGLRFVYCAQRSRQGFPLAASSPTTTRSSNTRYPALTVSANHLINPRFLALLPPVIRTFANAKPAPRVIILLSWPIVSGSLYP